MLTFYANTSIDAIFVTDVKEEPESPEGQRVLSMAEQFIAAMPARIKNEGDVNSMMLDVNIPTLGGGGGNYGSSCSPLICDTSQSDDLGIESMGDDLDLEFDFNLQVNCRYVVCRYNI